MSDVPFTLSFAEITEDAHPWVGGKGYNLGRLVRSGFPIPPGFCVTTEAYRQWLEGDQAFQSLQGELGGLSSDDLPKVQAAGSRLRGHLEERALPASISESILKAWREAGSERAYAVRSSATAEDLPDASFAGQQDTYLNVVGEQEVLESVRRCWASLYTDRAIVYRMQNNIPHQEVAISVVVQQMVQPESSGILFTADPLTGHRGIATIDAGFGLGEALVSGLISADLYKVDKGRKEIIETVIGDKKLEIVSLPGGGTEERVLSPARQKAQVLTKTQILELAALAEKVEKMQGCPQDIEWCFEEGTLYLVQSRPITSLYPQPAPIPDDDYARVYMCFNHFQVMLDPMPPVATELWRRILPLGKERPLSAEPSPLMRTAGNRLYLDLAPVFRHSLPRRVLLSFLKRVDHLAVTAMEQLVSRPHFAKGPKIPKSLLFKFFSGMGRRVFSSLWLQRPEGKTEELSRYCDEMVEDHRKRWFREGASYQELLKEARQDFGLLMPKLFFKVPPRIAAGVLALGLLSKLFPGRKEELADLGRGLPGNVTTDMDLEVGDLADLAREHPPVVALLRQHDITWAQLQEEPEAADFNKALKAFLVKYGSRGPSEIDISRDRWADQPESLLRTIAGNLATGESGSHRTHYKALIDKAEATTQTLLKESGRGLFGWLKRPLVRRLIRVHRHSFALREHPKFVLVRVIGLFRTLLLRMGEELVSKKSLGEAKDVFFLETTEVEEALQAPGVHWKDLVASRQEAHERYKSMFPPRVMSEDGEIPVAKFSREDVPEGALQGTSASAGVIEGVARVVLDPTKEVLHKGEILIAPFTDPGWTPLFINASGLVMEVGGQLTHGSVVAREYGIPAVVSVPDATKLIKTGQTIRVDGDRGIVEFIEEADKEVVALATGGSAKAEETSS